jgi:hypothetical protein
MTTECASCRCGKLRATVSGDPVRVSVCHCLNCKKRSGSAFAVQARWPSERVRIEGESKCHEILSDSGNRGIFHFCPECGSDVFYRNAGPTVDADFANLIAIPLGAFDDPFFVSPRFSVWEERKHNWLEIVGDNIERMS